MSQDNDAPAPGIATSKDASDLLDEKQIIGRKIWRIVPYIKRYWRRAVGGFAANAVARAFDLIPFVMIGAAADWYQSGTYTNSTLKSLVNSEHLPSLGPIGSVEFGYGLLILVSLRLAKILQGQLIGYQIIQIG